MASARNCLENPGGMLADHYGENKDKGMARQAKRMLLEQ
jgi:hypothetical protein